MHCPMCKLEMQKQVFEKLELEYCGDCGGVWLDSGEIEQLGAMTGAMRAGLLEALDKSLTLEHELSRKRHCPACQRPLVRVRPPQLAPVGLDRCPNFHGLWFDRGELTQVLARAGAAKASALAHFLAGLETQRRAGSQGKKD